MMRKWIAVTLLLACMGGAVQAEETLLPNVTEQNGRLTGQLASAQYGSFDIDAEVPVEFTPEQAVRIEVTFPRFTKTQMEAALKAAGTKRKEGDRLTRLVDGDGGYIAIYFRSDRLSSVGGLEANRRFENTYGAEHQASMAQAQTIAQAYLAALNVDVYPAWQSVWRGFSDGERQRETALLNALPVYQTRADRQHRENVKFYEASGLQENTATCLAMPFSLRGLEVMGQRTYPMGDAREPDATGGAICGASFVIGDDGIIWNAALEGYLVEKQAQPLPTPLKTWRQALAEFAGYAFWSGDYVDEEGNPWGAEKIVVTGLRPCYVGYDKGVFTPAWAVAYERRVAASDAVMRHEIAYVDAVGGQPVSL